MKLFKKALVLIAILQSCNVYAVVTKYKNIQLIPKGTNTLSFEDFCKQLKVLPTSNSLESELEQAYKLFARNNHSDKTNGDQAKEELLAQINSVKTASNFKPYYVWTDKDQQELLENVAPYTIKSGITKIITHFITPLITTAITYYMYQKTRVDNEATFIINNYDKIKPLLDEISINNISSKSSSIALRRFMKTHTQIYHQDWSSCFQLMALALPAELISFITRMLIELCYIYLRCHVNLTINDSLVDIKTSYEKYYTSSFILSMTSPSSGSNVLPFFITQTLLSLGASWMLLRKFDSSQAKLTTKTLISHAQTLDIIMREYNKGKNTFQQKKAHAALKTLLQKSAKLHFSTMIQSYLLKIPREITVHALLSGF